MKLFKLKSFEGNGLFYILDLICKKQIYLSTCESMNDINEGHWDYAQNPDAKYLEKASILREIVDSQRFTCFLKSISYPLMWAHYAGGFSGIALEYNFDSDKNDIREIIYEGAPVVSMDQIEGVISGNLLPQDIGILKQKAECWAYEDEWRLYGKGEYLENIAPKSVIFGAKSSKYSPVLYEIAEKWNLSIGYLNPVSDLNYEIEYINQKT